MGALNTLLLLQYNNYFNRIIKSENSYSDYIQAAIKNKPITGVNFNPNDGVDTEQIINWNEDWNPDYMVLFNDETNLVSRWFVTEAVRTRGRQYKLTLKRDVISDYYNEVVNESPCYILKGNVTNPNNNLLLNSENMRFNQVKEGETLLKDKTNCSWLVGYIAKNKNPESTTVSIDSQVTIPYIDIGTTLESWDLYQYSAEAGGKYKYDMDYAVIMIIYNVIYDNKKHFYQFIPYDAQSATGTVNEPVIPLITLKNATSSVKAKQILDRNYLIEDTNWIRVVNGMSLDLNIHTLTQFQDIISYKDKLIKTSDGKFYTVGVNLSYHNIFEDFSPATTNDNLMQAIKAISDENDIFTGDFVGSNVLRFGYWHEAQLTFTEEKVFEVTASMPSSRNKSVDAVYDLFAMPYNPNGEVLFNNSDNPAFPTGLNSKNQLTIAQALAGANGGGGANATIYDLQLLPYCPITSIIGNGNIIAPNDDYEDILYSFVKGTNQEVVGIIFYPPNASFSNTLNYTMSIPERDTNDSLNIKLSNELDMYRLVSPNYNGQFDFNLAKNGEVNYIDIDCTYRPFNPYIHVAPRFGRLYGTDFNDNRGLICNGDFSVGMFGDQFATYQLQNKNYQNIFDRQIQNMDVLQDIERDKAGANIALGLAGGAAAGVIAGTTTTGNPIGAVGGALVGGVMGLTSGIVNYDVLSQTQKEKRSYAVDMYNYSLKNIQALPYSLTKSGEFVVTNKYYPFIEYYSATNEEENALKNKIIYNGMTINVIGKIADYINKLDGYDYCFIKGEMIRIEGVGDDTHLLNAIYDEIAKGVYL